MRILLLTCNTGGGHNSAAEAVCCEFVKRSIDCEIQDALSFVSKSYSEIISNGHTYVYRYLPRLFGAAYRFEERHKPRFIYEQVALGAKRFAEFLNSHPCDAIVSCHIFGSMLVTAARKRYGLKTPHYAVMTDYALCPGIGMVDAKRVFIPAEELRGEYICEHIDNDRIVTSGIPVRNAFSTGMDKATARTRLKLSPKDKVILLFSGSIGCGKLHLVAPVLEKALPRDTTLVIICGRNKKLYERLRESCGSRTRVVGHTSRVAEYMAAADLCITKPGGLSTTELLVSHLPMVLMLSVPGCETHNLDYFVGHGVAVGTDNWDEAIRLTLELIGDTERLDGMRRRLEHLGYPGGATVVADTVLKDFSFSREQCNDEIVFHSTRRERV